MEPNEIFNSIFDILVERAGASPKDRDSFVSYYLKQRGTEFRFCGRFGLAGKFWRNGSYYITGHNTFEISRKMYSEEAIVISKVNELLKQFPYWEPEA